MGKRIEWILRMGVFGTFLGHGILAIQVNPRWISYLNTVGFPDELAVRIMPIIGIIDIFIALTILSRPLKPIVLYAILWTFLTALIRPVSGEPILHFIERSANWAAPLALYTLIYTSYGKKLASEKAEQVQKYQSDNNGTYKTDEKAPDSSR